MTLSLFILFLLSVNHYNPVLAENGKFNACKQTIQCVNVTNVTYPFYDGKTRPEYCGYPGFKLDCKNDGLHINISNQDYHFWGMNNKTSTIKVSRTDQWSGYCPDHVLNTTIDFTKFNFSTGDQNITFFYDCDQNDLFSNLLPHSRCNLLGSLTTVYYLIPKVVDSNMVLSSLFHACKSSLYLPVLQSEAEAIDNSPTLSSLINAFRAGFELGFIADTDLCNSCIGSGGECGFDSGRGKFACCCADGEFGSRCGVDPLMAKGYR